MERWILASKLYESGRIDEVNLVSVVKSGELTAYDCNSDNPIDWQILEEQFGEIKILCERNQPKDNGDIVLISPRDRSRKAVLMKAKLSTYSDCYPVPWNILYDYLKSGRPVEIPETQYFKILEGWGNNQMSQYVKAAKFKEAEVDKVIQPEPDRTASSSKGPNSKREEAASRNIIGGLLELLQGKYDLQQYNTTFPITSASKIQQILINELDGFYGISQRTLESRFAEAKKALDDF